MTPAEAEAAEFTGRRGDDIARRWVRSSGTSVLSGELLVQIRAGSRHDSPLVASSVPGDVSGSVALIETAGTDLDGDPPVIAWQIARAEYEKLPPGAGYWLGIHCLVDGLEREVQRHRWTVTDETAVVVS